MRRDYQNKKHTTGQDKRSRDMIGFPVYPSLESEEDNPVFKSRSKKRKSSDDTPYSPTGRSQPSTRGSHHSAGGVGRDGGLKCLYCLGSASGTVSPQTGAAGQRGRQSGLHRDGTGGSGGQALASGAPPSGAAAPLNM